MLKGIEKIVVIAGCQRSGTTLTGQMVGAHPGAYLIDETDGLYEWFDAHVEKSPERPRLWRQMLARARAKYRNHWTRIDKSEQGKLGLGPGVTHLVLKAPNLTYRYRELAAFARPVSVVFPIRDARAVVASMGKVRYQPMVQNQLKLLERFPHIAADYVDEIAALRDETQPDHVKRALVWRIKSLMHEKFARENIETFVFRYEDLIADPRAVCMRIADSIGLPFDEAMLEHGNIYQGQGPGLTERSRPVDGESLEGWVHRLAPAQAADVLTVTSAAMTKLGYRPEASVATAAPKPSIDEKVLRSPIILAGRGGSGTRLLSDLARQAGIFIGNRFNKASDSVEWLDLIYEIGIDSVAPDLDGAEADPQQWEPLLLAKARHMLAAGTWSVGMPWGWKLPETMLSIPQLSRVFTRAKLVHLVRHPVSSSLRRIHMTSRLEHPIGSQVVHAAYRRLGLEPALVGQHQGYMHNAVTWLYQVDRVVQFGRNHLGPERYVEVRYEDLCADPAGAWKPVVKFLGLPWTTPSLPNIETERMQDFDVSDPRIDEVWALCEPTARKLGYEPIR